MSSFQGAHRERCKCKVLVIILLVAQLQQGNSFSKLSPPQFKDETTAQSFNRRELLWKIPVGGVASYVYGRLCYNALSVQDIKYPEEHERRVRSTIELTLQNSVPQSPARKLKVLEVGAGKDIRLLRRGLYDGAFVDLKNAGNVQEIELVAVDLLSPAENALLQTQQREFALPMDFTYLTESIESNLNYPEGYFDAIICCLTLCSVEHVDVALKEMNRLLRPDGGCLGYIEHVAVDPDEPYKLLEFQQKLLDPLQQKLADNCHLHRYTEQSIAQEFLKLPNARQVARERYTVDSMWPVSCQLCGVVQKQTPTFTA